MRILISGTKGFSQFLKKLSHRGETGFAEVAESVKDILNRVRVRGDRALVQLTRKYDGWKATPESLRVSRRDMEFAWKGLSREERVTLKFAAERIERFHVLQRQTSWSFAEEDGTILGQIVRPMDRVGIYVPGGKAAYPSSVLMNAIPARVAGVREIIMACPRPKGISEPCRSGSRIHCRSEGRSLKLAEPRPLGHGLRHPDYPQSG